MCTDKINMELLYIYNKLDRARERAETVNKF